VAEVTAVRGTSMSRSRPATFSARVNLTDTVCWFMVMVAMGHFLVV
jgi:hypothetical protein